MIRPALRHLHKADPIMRALIRRIGPCTFEPRRGNIPLRGARAGRRPSAAPRTRGGEPSSGASSRSSPASDSPGPDDVPRTSMKRVAPTPASRAPRSCAIKHIAGRRCRSSADPARGGRMTDEDMILQLTQLRGVGRWTVEMLLMFTLGRPDVLPVDDFGIREGFRITYGLRTRPTPKQVLVHGERWRPHRTIASWYLWRAVEHAGRPRVGAHRRSAPPCRACSARGASWRRVQRFGRSRYPAASSVTRTSSSPSARWSDAWPRGDASVGATPCVRSTLRRARITGKTS